MLFLAKHTTLSEGTILKRKIRESYRLLSKDLKQGYHIVFLWNKKVPIEQLDFHIISQDMKFIFFEGRDIAMKKVCIWMLRGYQKKIFHRFFKRKGFIVSFIRAVQNIRYKRYKNMVVLRVYG